MSIEIERKFKVKGDFRPYVICKKHIKQGYLNFLDKATARIRITDGCALLGIKSTADKKAIGRHEYEYEIPVEDAIELLELRSGNLIEKERHEVKVGKHIFEVDVFEGENEGLIVAEVELTSEDEEFDKPEWLGEEVSNDLKYYNASLAIYPYKKWK